MSNAPETIWIWAFSKDGELYRNECSWPAQQTDDDAKQHAPIQYRRADLVDAEIERLRTEVETLRQRREGEYARMLEWRGIDQGDECKKCGGAGVTAYGSTATWRGGIGGQVITAGICDKCWGSGNSNRPWLSLRKLEAERQRARLPEELVERIRTAVEYDLQEQFGGNLVKRILEDILAAVEPQT